MCQGWVASEEDLTAKFEQFLFVLFMKGYL